MIVYDPAGKFDRELTLLDLTLKGLSRLADTHAFPGIQKIGQSARSKAAELTPEGRDPRDVDDPPFTPEISERWVTDVDGATKTVVVTNDHLEGNEEFPTGKGSILEALEFGTKPHTIKARNPGSVLLHFTDRTLTERFETKVRHPGNRPFGMLAGATTLALGEMTGLVERLARVVETTWTKPGGALAGLDITISRE